MTNYVAAAFGITLVAIGAAFSISFFASMRAVSIDVQLDFVKAVTFSFFSPAISGLFALRCILEYLTGIINDESNLNTSDIFFAKSVLLIS